MIKKKICLLGEFGVGKTSLVARFVHDYFGDQYLTTVGVSIQQKIFEHRGENVCLILWDVAGEQAGLPINSVYLKGMSAYIIVCDVTMENATYTVKYFEDFVMRSYGPSNSIVLLNKVDRLNDFSNLKKEKQYLEQNGHKVFMTSAKTGESVQEAFDFLVDILMEESSVHGRA